MNTTLSPTTQIVSRTSWLRLSSSQQTLLKWLAIALMLLDHANRTLWSFQPWAFALGRLAFPLFAFFIAYNIVVREVRPGKYLLPLLVFGIISQIPAMLALERGLLPLNIFFTLLLGSSFLALRSWFARQLPNGRAWQSLSWLVSIYLILLFGVIIEYGPLGMLLIPAMMGFLKRPSWLSGAVAILLLVGINSPLPSSLAALLIIPVNYAVSNLKLPTLPRTKWFFYAFYPAHLAVLWLLKSIL